MHGTPYVHINTRREGPLTSPCHSLHLGLAGDQFGVIFMKFYVIMFFGQVGPKSKEGDTRITKSSQRRVSTSN